MKAKDVLTELKRRFPNEPEYHQAVEEVLNTIEDTYNRNIEFEKKQFDRAALYSRSDFLVSGDLDR